MGRVIDQDVGRPSALDRPARANPSEGGLGVSLRPCSYPLVHAPHRAHARHAVKDHATARALALALVVRMDLLEGDARRDEPAQSSRWLFF